MSQDESPSRTQDRMLFHLKTLGPQSAAAVATRFGMTSVGARQHLLGLQELGLVESERRREGRGRPKLIWRLSRQGHGRFPDRHADLTLDLLTSTRAVFGETGVDRLIAHRERASIGAYAKALGSKKPLRARLDALARERTREGYMARVEATGDGGFLLLENHCPICAAAEACQGLCRSELSIFRTVLGKDITVDRLEHIPAGARRCAYRVRKRSVTKR
jgi:predicted ArsR family transcriptional regulator